MKRVIFTGPMLLKMTLGLSRVMRTFNRIAREFTHWCCNAKISVDSHIKNFTELPTSPVTLQWVEYHTQ
jgi:hypothetical protein